ncbi:MAG: phosphotransferase [Firmicutes bacterium]|nr:phosphotransferase [Bacillota bacterium]
MPRELLYNNGRVKLYRDGGRAIKVLPATAYGYLKKAANRQAFARDAGLPVPAVHGLRRAGRQIELYMDYVDGQGFASEEIAVIEMAKLHARIGRVNGAGLPRFSKHIAREIKKSPHLAGSVKKKLLSLLRRLDTGKTNLCHGDMHPGNLLFDGEKTWIIDWSPGSVSRGDPAADACNTYLYQLRFTPQYAKLYLRTFCVASGVAREDVLAWLPVIAGYQVNIKDGEERRFILDIISPTM